MLQVALGGHQEIEETASSIVEDDFFNDAPNTYLEPGFNILFPLDITSPEADLIYVLLRKRLNQTETSFATLDASDFSVVARDVTTGEDLTAGLTANTINTSWNAADFDPLVLSIEPFSADDENQSYRTRVIEVTISEDSTNDFIFFRVQVSSSTQPFAFLTVTNHKQHLREDTAYLGTSGLIDLVHDGSYTLLSPLATFEETDIDTASFSYPPNQIFYKREDFLNNEEFDFTISEVSHTEILVNTQLLSVPQFPYMAVLIIDGYARENLKAASGVIYIDIKATGRISAEIDTFRMYLSKSDGIFIMD